MSVRKLTSPEHKDNKSHRKTLTFAEDGTAESKALKHEQSTTSMLKQRDNVPEQVSQPVLFDFGNVD